MAYELPFILYNNFMETAALTVSSEESGFPKENLVDWLDWTYWKATSTATQTIDFLYPGGISLDRFAMLGHNLGSGGNSIGARIRILTDSNPAFPAPQVLADETITDDNPFYLAIGSHLGYYRIEISRMADPVYIAVAWMGFQMEIPVGPEFSFDPDMQDIKSEKFVSYSGRMVSSAVKYPERKMNVSFKRIAQSFIISDILPFLEDHYGQMKPFFFVPDPGDVFGVAKIYYLVAPDNPSIGLPVSNEDKGYRNWTLIAQGVRQSTFR